MEEFGELLPADLWAPGASSGARAVAETSGYVSGLVCHVRSPALLTAVFFWPPQLRDGPGAAVCGAQQEGLGAEGFLWPVPMGATQGTAAEAEEGAGALRQKQTLPGMRAGALLGCMAVLGTWPGPRGREAAPEHEAGLRRLRQARWKLPAFTSPLCWAVGRDREIAASCFAHLADQLWLCFLLFFFNTCLLAAESNLERCADDAG